MRLLRVLPSALLVIAALAVPAASSAVTASRATSAVAYPDWPTYHGSANRAGVSTTMPAAKGAPTVLRSVHLDAAVFGSPIVVHGIVIVATVNDSVYGLTPTGRVLWRSTFGPPARLSQLPCGDVDPSGIIGTPTYSADSGLVYFVVEHGGPVRKTIAAIDPRTGKLKASRPLTLPDTDQVAMQQRGALNIAGGRVWVTFGARAGDCGNYKGRIIGLPLMLSGTAVAYTIPNDRQGGMWNPAGPTVDIYDRIYQAVGNGSAFPGDAYDYTNSVLEFDTSAKLISHFSPTTWARDNQGDVGLGSQAPALVGNYVFVGGKSTTAYTMRRDDLGGIGGQVDKMELCKSFGGTAVYRGVVYVPCTDGVRAVGVDADGQMSVLWHAASNIVASPVLGGGRLWTVDRGAGVLYGLDPATGRSLGSVAVGAVTHFPAPALYGRYVLVPTLSGLSIVRSS